MPFRHSFDHAPGSWGVHGAGQQPRRERNEIQKRKDEGRKLEELTQITNVNVNAPDPRARSRSGFYISFSFALHSRAPYQAFRRRRVSLAVRSHSENLLGEPEAEATNGTPAADGPGTQGTHRSRHSSGSIITEAAHNAEGTPQRAHGSPRTPARTLRGNARTTHAKWIFIRIQHADDA